ncbi:type II toxin-antitoxin system VapC family toxin [Candidatus Woesebacteria bacterium]|nr:type II toxin-antitoxin system VapC family toxin [Candidatus Woesebacteria bacterium]
MILLDTHTLIWWISDRKKLSRTALAKINAAAETTSIYISPISIWEIAMLVEKKRLELTIDVQTWVNKIVNLPMIQLTKLDHQVLLRSVLLSKPSGIAHNDPVDRMLVATAIQLNIPLISKDRRLAKYPGVKIIW